MVFFPFPKYVCKAFTGNSPCFFDKNLLSLEVSIGKFDKNLLSLEVSIGKFDKYSLSLEVSIGKPRLYVKEKLPQNVVLGTDDRADGTVGKSAEGADAYPPLLLLKCFLIQQWFHIDSDPELETQINDRISFKKFLGLSFDQLSPDHSPSVAFVTDCRKKQCLKSIIKF